MTSDAEVQALATEVLRHWGGTDRPPRLIKNRENAVFEVYLTDKTRAALRLHRPGYQTAAAIESELIWTQLLAEKQFRASSPVPTQSGELTASVNGRQASLINWCDGQSVGSGDSPLRGTPKEQAALFTAIGRLVADLHNATDELRLPEGFTRPDWDEAGLLGDRPFWGRFWDNPALSDTETGVLQAARRAALTNLAAFRRDGADFGLIHADVLRENILSDAAGLSMIDFDDCGFGFRMYDLGTALSQSLEEPELSHLAAALLRGYRAARALPDHAADRLTLFVMLRALASCGWIVSRALPTDPRQRFYAERALRMARMYLDGRSLIDLV